jgi:predicted GIY-YIG superfamily endonuclease
MITKSEAEDALAVGASPDRIAQRRAAITMQRAVELGVDPDRAADYSSYDFDLCCDVCGELSDAQTRSRLASARARVTLCSLCFLQWRSLRELAARTRACARCSADYLYHPTRHDNTGTATRCYPCVEADKAEAAAQKAEKLREERAARRRRYSGPPRLGYVYRLYDADGQLLYIGKTYNVAVRLLWAPQSHAKTKTWFRRVSMVSVTVYRTETDALAAEAWAIQREAPLKNRAHPLPFTKRAPRSLCRYSGPIR